MGAKYPDRQTLGGVKPLIDFLEFSLFGQGLRFVEDGLRRADL